MHDDPACVCPDLDSPSGQAGRPLGVFTREKDLQASIKDLDHMFDSDEDDNDDMVRETTQVVLCASKMEVAQNELLYCICQMASPEKNLLAELHG